MPELTFHEPHGPVWIFLAVAVAIVVGPWVAERARLPSIIGLLAAGMLIGPSGLDIVHAADTIVPALGQLGLLYLMFLAGAELDFDVVRRHRNAVIVFSLLTFAFPMAFGFGSAVVLGYSTAAALLLGSLWASHTLLAYPAVRGAGLSANRAVATAVGATIATDTLSLIVLAGVAGWATGAAGGMDLAAQVVVGLVLLVAWCTVALPLLGRLFVTRISHEPPARYAFVLGALLSAAVLAEVVGIEAIVGAFFAGLGLNRLLPNAGPMFERLEFYGSALLVPLFLISVGLIIDPSVMVGGETLALAGVFVVACLGGKAAAAIVCRPLFGYSWNEVGLTFSLSSAQAAATLAATFVGFEVGLIGTTVVNAVLIVIFASVIAASLSAAYFARRTPPTVETSYKPGRVVLLLVASDASPRAAAHLAGRIASPDGGVVIPVLATVNGTATSASARAALAQALHNEGLDCHVTERADASLGSLLRHTAAAEGASAAVIVLGATDIVTGRLVASVAEAIEASPIPTVAVMGDAPLRTLRRVARTASAAGDNVFLGHLRRAGLALDAPEPAIGRQFRVGRRLFQQAAGAEAQLVDFSGAATVLPDDGNLVLVGGGPTG